MIVTGSRSWSDQEAVATTLAVLASEHGELTVIHGACPRGADKIAAEWCRRQRQPGLHWGTGGATVHEERHPAAWETYGRRAGYVRNAEMVDAGADLVLAFCVAGSPGTMHTVNLAEKAGIPVRLTKRPA